MHKRIRVAVSSAVTAVSIALMPMMAPTAFLDSLSSENTQNPVEAAVQGDEASDSLPSTSDTEDVASGSTPVVRTSKEADLTSHLSGVSSKLQSSGTNSDPQPSTPAPARLLSRSATSTASSISSPSLMPWLMERAASTPLALFTALSPESEKALWGSGGNTLDDFGSCGDQTMMLMSSSSVVQRVCGGKVVDSYDIPSASLAWISGRDNSAPYEQYWRRETRDLSGDLGTFNSLAVDRKNQQMWAVESDQLDSTGNGSVLLWNYTDTGNGAFWNAVDARKGPIVAKWQSKNNADYVTPPSSPRFSNTVIYPTVASTTNKNYPNKTKTATNPERALSFSGAGTIFNVGIMAEDGTYIFGGPRHSNYINERNGENNSLRLFARKPSTGQIVYLGHVDLPSAQSISNLSVQNDIEIQFDRDGNLFVLYGQVQGRATPIGLNEPRTYKSMVTVERDSLAQALANPAATWNAWEGNTGVWQTPRGVTKSMGADKNNFTKYSRQIPSGVNYLGREIKVPGATPKSEPAIYDGNGNLVLGAQYSEGYDPSNQTQVGNVMKCSLVNGQCSSLYKTTHTYSNQTSVWRQSTNGLPQYPGGGLWDYQFNEIEGFFTPPSIVVSKKIVGGKASPADQFTVSITAKSDPVTGENITRSGTTKLTGEGSEELTSFIMIPGTQFQLAEKMAPGSKSPLSDYQADYQCTYRSSSGATKQIRGARVGTSSGEAFTVPNDAVGQVNCMVTNTYEKASTQVKLQKAISGVRIDNADQFVLSVSGDGVKTTSATTTGTRGQITSQPITVETNTQGASITISETLAQTSGTHNLADYGAALQCRITDRAGVQSPLNVQLSANTARNSSTFRIPTQAVLVDCVLTNTPKGFLNFEKVGVASLSAIDSDGAGVGNAQHLGGSEWIITKQQGGSTVGKIRDWEAQAGTTVPKPEAGFLQDTDPRQGYISVKGLDLGTYVLTETKAPTGYSREGSTRMFTVAPMQPIASFSGNQAIANEQLVPPQLPLTGGLGRDAFLIGAGVLLVTALGVFILLGRKRTTN